MVLFADIVQALKIPPQDRPLAFDHLCHDTRWLGPDDLFIVLPGSNFSAEDLIGKAFRAGAKAVVADISFEDSRLIKVPDVKKALQSLIPLFYPRSPYHRLAVTGTDGKTSTTHLWQQLWALIGVSSAAMGTMGISSSIELSCPFPDLTTPSYLTFCRIFDELAARDIQHVSFEASSHALDQGRLDSLSAPIGIFTSFSQDHLDYHKTLEQYWQAKCHLFTRHISQTALLFNGLHRHEDLAQLCHHLSVMYYGPKAKAVPYAMNATYEILPSSSIHGHQVNFHIGPHLWESWIPLVGEFQIANLLAALCAFYLQNGSLESLIPLLGELKPIRGRMDYRGHYNGGDIYIDFAHTPEGLVNVLKALRPYTRGKLGLIMGCGGQRDQTKRSLMGHIAHTYADWVIITDDNPRYEDPEAIRKDILGSCPKGQEIFPREKAILWGMKALEPGDVLLIAGKGHEEVQIIGNERKKFSDHTWVEELLQSFLA